MTERSNTFSMLMGIIIHFLEVFGLLGLGLQRGGTAMAVKHANYQQLPRLRIICFRRCRSTQEPT
jgi:hypothetical protein